VLFCVPIIAFFFTGDVLLEVDGKNVEEEDHKTIVGLIHDASESVRFVQYRNPQRV